MSDFLKKFKKRWNNTVIAFRSDRTFSPQLAWYRAIDDVAHRIHLKRLSSSFHQKKDEFILSFLSDFLQPVIQKYKVSSYTGEPSPTAPIWVCWWTGEESAPPIVKQCIKSIRANANGHPVHLITKDNYFDYLDIPDYIINKVNEKKLGLANFSDYLRFSLIAKHGGLWIDSTIFCREAISSSYFSLPVFTCKSPERDSRFISRYRWTSFCLGGWKGHVLFSFLQEAFESFWKVYDTAIDYLFVDYLIAIAYQELPQANRELSNVPINNLHRDDLQAAMCAGLPAEEFANVLCEDTILYKLSWRESYTETTDSGTETIYGAFIHGHLPEL